MQSQKLCLKWNNHTPNLLSVLGSFQQKESLVDVTISCEGHNIKAHKIVLSACSPYFQDIFLDNPCQHPIIFMNGMKFEDIAAILNFMYKGEVNVSHDGLSSFLQAAEALKVKGLAEVCGEKNSTNSISQDVQQSEQSRPPRTDTPPRKRQRNRKRSLSDSNRSDDEGSTRKQHREPSSPEVHELSGDESFTGDNSSNGTPFNSTPRVPQKAFSRSHQPSSNLGDEDDYEMDADKLLEQNMTTETTSMNNSTDNNLRIERIMGNATEMESSSLQDPESPPDIKPIINFGESSTGASEGALMSYNEQSQFSQPGPSSAQDSTLLHDSSHNPDFQVRILQLLKSIVLEQKAIRAMVTEKSAISARITLPRDCPSLPIETLDGVEAMETYLKNEENFKIICNYFGCAGGTSVKETTRRILSGIISNPISLLFSWKGTGGTKLAFATYLNLVKLITTAVRQHERFENATNQEVENAIKKWFAHARDRDGGRSRRNL